MDICKGEIEVQNCQGGESPGKPTQRPQCAVIDQERKPFSQLRRRFKPPA